MMMTGDDRSQNGSPPQTGALASTSDQKLSIELPSSRQIHTIGSAVSGLVHLGTKERSAIQMVHVSLVCKVVSLNYHLSDDKRVSREINKLLHLDKTLWSRVDGDIRDPPTTFSFHFAIPEFGYDAGVGNPQAPLPPSFYPDSNKLSGTPIGYITYYIKASVARKGVFNHTETAYCPIFFLPPSPPPPLFAISHENISVQDLDHLNGRQWSGEIAISNLHSGVFRSKGKATLTLWLPPVSSFPRFMHIPFILRLTLQTQHVKGNVGEEPSKTILPPPPYLDKASLHLTQRIWTHVSGTTQVQTRTFDNSATDNFLHGITPQEGAWLPKKADMMFYWEKGYMWRGSWTFKEAPTFSNRQLTWKYELVAEIPIKGLRNSAELASRELEVSSDVRAGTNVIPPSAAGMVELPSDYFNTENYDDDLHHNK